MAHTAKINGDRFLPLPNAKDQQLYSIILTGADYNKYLQY